MSTPLAEKTTISSRSRATTTSQLNGVQRDISGNIMVGGRMRPSKLQPPGRNRPLSSAAVTDTPTATRLANLVNGFPTTIKDRRTMAGSRPATSSAFATVSKASAIARPSLRPAIANTTSRIIPPHPRLTATLAQSSRSSSIVSSVSSTATKRPLTFSTANTDSRRQASSVSTNNNHIPDTNAIRKGLAKFSNPMECQRQYQALSLKIRKLDDIIEAREKDFDRLQEQLKFAINVGLGYATTVQYFDVKLKLDSETNLIEECEQLKCKVSSLIEEKKQCETNLETIVDDYKSHLLVEQDLRNNLQRELDETRNTHSEFIERMRETHTEELDDLNQRHSNVESEMQSRIETLELELRDKCKELTELRKDHESLTNSFNKLEETLTKDKDARVKYAQDKISQLQKDVDSLNSVLEMRLERIHALEKDSILLTEVQNELDTQKDTNKSLNQQIESLNAALEKKREQFENLIVEHEKIRQELKSERKERRRMTMKTEQLEYALNESCASESNIAFNTSIRDLDSADHLV